MKNFKKTIISISTFALVMAATLSPNSCPISKINPIVPISASAAEVSEGCWKYDISNGEATITKYTGKDEELSIPSSIGECPVRHIADDAFKNKTSLESVKIPEGVKSIGNSAFMSCKNLNKISLPSSLEFIGDSAFMYTSLVDVVIPANVKSIGSFSFYSCKNLNKVSLPSSLEVIGYSAFMYTSLVDVVIPANVKSIESLSFYAMESLKTVTIKGNTTVDDDAFGYSESIESIKFNYNYRSNFTKAFKSCVNLQYINNIPILNEEEYRLNTRYLDIIKNLENNTYVNKYIHEYAPDKVGEEWQYEIHDGEVTITKYTGTDAELSIPSTIVGLPVRHIAYQAFSGNTSLESVKIPEEVKSIENSAFRSCENLNTISLPSSLESIGGSAFAFTSLEDVVIPANVKSIDYFSFDSIESLKTVTIMGNTTVTDDTFGYSESIESIKFNYNYRSNFTTAFKNCVNLQYINDKSITYKGSDDELCVNTKYLDIIKNLEDNKYVNEYVHDKAMRIVNKVTNKDMTDVQIAKALHDWICNHVEYDHDDMWAPKNHIEGSVILYDTTVCEGYARGYNLLLNLAGIESYYVHSDDCYNEDGETHGWNIVKLGDHYFHIDVCWDDGYQDYRWFMNSDEEVSRAGGAKAKWIAENADTPICDCTRSDVYNDDFELLDDLISIESTPDGE